MPEETVVETIAELDEAMTVRDALAELTPECAEILDRFFTRDESYRTIGESLDLPAGTVASRISRCLSKLRERLEGRKSVARSSSVQVTR
jgi:RNA polymerase sigma factor (sigma-70 family)